MPVLVEPDHIAALNLRLRSFPEITALVGAADGYTASARTVDRAKPRISPLLQAFWLLPHYAIVLRKMAGPPPDRDGRIRTSRVDLWCYGPGEDAGTQEREAGRLCRTVRPALMPGHGQTDAFVLADCRVYGVLDAAEAFPFVDQATGYRLIVVPIAVIWSMEPVS